MLFNFVKLFFRQVRQNPFYVTVNVIGLSIGYSSFLFLWSYTQAELQADQFPKDHERIYRVYMRGKYFQNAPVDLAIGEPAVVKHLANNFREIEDYTRVFHFSNLAKEYVPDHGPNAFFLYTNAHGNPSRFEESRSAYVDPNFVDFFSVTMVEGNAKSCLASPFAVVLSERVAQKYFGQESALGGTLLLDGKVPLTVTGVFKELPRNSHLDLDLLISTASIEKTINQIILASGGPWCYIRIQPGADAALLEERIKPVSLKLDETVIHQCGDCSLEYRLQPLKEIYYSGSFVFDLHQGRSKAILISLAGVSIIILVMGWINYASIVVALQRKRTKDLMVRRAMGAQSIDFSAQYLVESGIVNLLALLVALTILQIVGSPLQEELGLYFPEWEFLSTNVIPAILFFFISAVFVTGLYPALVASRSARARLGIPGLASTIPKMPVGAIQFSFALALIIVMFVISDQLNYVKALDVGFSKKDVLIVDLPLNGISQLDATISSLLDQVSAIDGVEGVSVSAYSFDDTPELVIRQSESIISPKTLGGIDENFIPLYSIRLVEGRNFMAGHPADHKSIILSQRATQMLGYLTPIEAIGKMVSIEKSEWSLDFEEAEIIGVTEDIRIKPFFKAEREGHGVAFIYKSHLTPTLTQARKLSLQINPERFVQTSVKVERTCRNSFPGEMVSSYPLQDRLILAYGQDDATSKRLLVASGIAVSIACLGLLGMAVNRAESKTKEIGIRKVLGAEITQLASFLFHSTFRDTLWALFLSIPLAYFLAQQYLEKFTDRIAFAWWHVVIPLILVLVIIVATISQILWKAVRANPVEALKYE